MTSDKQQPDYQSSYQSSKKTSNTAVNDTSFNTALLDILACPLTKTPLEYNAQTQELISRSAELAFPIRNGIPILLKDEARPLSSDITL